MWDKGFVGSADRVLSVPPGRFTGMSITVLAVEALPSATAAGDPRELVRALEAAFDEHPVSGLGWEGVADAELLDLVVGCGRLASRLAGVRLGALAETDRRGAGRSTGAPSTVQWLQAGGTGPGTARRDVGLAQALTEHAGTREALGAGRISQEQAAVIASALDSLSGAVQESARRATEAALLEAAASLDPGRLRHAARHAAARVDPGGSGDLAAQEKSARSRRELVVFANRDGMHTLAGSLDVEGAAILAAALDPLSAPRPSSADGPDPRTPSRRRADALIELARRALAAGDLPDCGGDRPQVIVTMTLEQLRVRLDDATSSEAAGTGAAGPGAADVGVGVGSRVPLSIASARRIACDAQVIPVLLGSAGEVLDLGRGARTANRAQRRALVQRDGGCAFTGCGRPPAWCDAHHIRAWAAGGRTDLANLVLLCGHHHDVVHHDGWTIRIGPDHRPVFRPPPTPPPDPPDPPW